jgi:serine/threonine protein phosphatase PrpC
MEMDVSLGHAMRAFQETLGGRPPCGDGWLCLEKGKWLRLMLADGLGHGSHAHQIVSELKLSLAWICHRSSLWVPLSECMQALHQRLRQQGSQVQACVALLDIDREQAIMRCLNVGNIHVQVHGPDSSLVLAAMPGMVGGRLSARLRVSELAVRPGTLVSLCSDGMESTRSRDWLQHLYQRSIGRRLDLQWEAEAMVRRFAKSSDDASCLLVRLGVVGA